MSQCRIVVTSLIFDNPIDLTADWYKRNNFDLIGRANTQGVVVRLIDR